MTPVAVALDLGSTRIKAALLSGDGELFGLRAADAPTLTGTDGVREGDAPAYLAVAESVLRETLAGHIGLPLGVACQRSTFLLWDAASGKPRTPMISWQDTRAADWCAAHAALEPLVRERSGLVLSPHYAGPKLARLLEEDAGLRRDAAAGRLRFGNLDGWLLRCWGVGSPHETDRSMAARTTMLDLATGDWCDELLEAYGVDRQLLPDVTPTAERQTELRLGAVLAASIADQASGAIAVLSPGDEDALVTLGTGGFVLRSASTAQRRPGYLTAPILGGRRVADDRYTLEGTINGAGAALDRFPGDVRLTDDDPFPEAFCIPDVAGLGSPFWRPSITLTFSPAARRLDADGQRRIVVEGLLFRIRQIVDDLDVGDRLRLSGGVASRPEIPPALATLTGRTVERLLEREAGLLGAARLAAGPSTPPTPAVESFPPTDTPAYLQAKYSHWSSWVDEQVGG